MPNTKKIRRFTPWHAVVVNRYFVFVSALKAKTIREFYFLINFHEVRWYIMLKNRMLRWT